MTDLSHIHIPSFSLWNRISALFARRRRKPGSGPRNPQMFIDRAMSRLPEHLLRDIGLFDGNPE